jgi:GT2 family glycosyltransferase
MTSRSVCVAVVSRNRPAMVRNAIASLQSIEAPQGTSVTILLVENGTGEELGTLVRDLASRPSDRAFVFEVEPEVGISSARNRALRYAYENACDRLAFIDDDEIASSTWLVDLTRVMEAREAQLVGGPVRPFVRETLNLPQGMVWRGYLRRCAKVERRALRWDQALSGRGPVIITNNWLVDVAFCRTAGLMFDPRFNLSGGEDTDFFHRFISAGGTSAWAPDAVAFEEMPGERLTAGYQFARAANSTNTRLQTRLRPRARVIECAGLLLFKSIIGLVLALASFVTFGMTLYSASRNLGIAAGAALALLQVPTAHYRSTTGG